MAKREKEYPGLKRQLEELKEMQRQQSPLMHVTGCLQRLELKEKEELYESMFRYLQKSEGSEGSEKRKKTEKLEKLKELE